MLVRAAPESALPFLSTALLAQVSCARAPVMAKEDSKTVIRIRFIVPPLQGWLKPIIAIASRQRLNCAVTRPNWHPAFAHKHPGARLIGVAWCLGIIAWSLLIALLRSSRAPRLTTPPYSSCTGSLLLGGYQPIVVLRVLLIGFSSN